MILHTAYTQVLHRRGTYTHPAYIPQPKNTCPLESTAKMVLHSEQRKRPERGAFNFLEHTGQVKIFGNMPVVGTTSCLKNAMASSAESLILKN